MKLVYTALALSLAVVGTAQSEVNAYGFPTVVLEEHITVIEGEAAIFGTALGFQRMGCGNVVREPADAIVEFATRWFSLYGEGIMEEGQTAEEAASVFLTEAASSNFDVAKRLVMSAGCTEVNVMFKKLDLHLAEATPEDLEGTGFTGPSITGSVTTYYDPIR